MKKLLASVVLLFGFHDLALSQSAVPVTAQSHPRTGVLLLAHGGSREWNEEVRHVADQVDLSVPTEVAFGMATRPAMQAAMDRLKARGVTEIVAVPLFVNSHSSLVDSIAYLLGQRTQMPEDLKMFAAMGSMDHGGAMDHGAMHDSAQAADATKPIPSSVPVRMAPALDHHRIVADILRDRAASVSQDPAHEGRDPGSPRPRCGR